HSSNNILIGNAAVNSGFNGFLVELNSNENLISHNTASGSQPITNGESASVAIGAGFAFLHAASNTVESNVAYSNLYGFDLSDSIHNHLDRHVVHANRQRLPLYDN